MKKILLCTVALTTAALLALPALAAESCCPPPAAAGAKTASPADPHAGMDMGGGDTVKIHDGKKDGYGFAYDIMPMAVAGATHHLMVAITDPAQKAVTGAKVGFEAVGPDKKSQKAMAMAMGGAYGANLNLAAKGKYGIKTKAVAGDKTLTYEFSYEVK